MLEDFLEYNKLKSKIIKFPNVITIGKLANAKKIPPTRGVKLRLFNTKKNAPFICVTPFKSNLNLDKVSALVNNVEFIEMDELENVLSCGYKKGMIPLLSIYGIKLIIHTSLQKKESLVCQVSDKSVLDTLMTELLGTNDDLVFEDIV
jgi:prolyl-tRNA editing enzyme YbaK/EbsC (Cys-tRNA(Pro) deacylase)